ncbi:hypothetical protein [Bacillus coahuilensis]|nr:hypothetical protein [Bacillus coahuilensis]
MDKWIRQNRKWFSMLLVAMMVVSLLPMKSTTVSAETAITDLFFSRVY